MVLAMKLSITGSVGKSGKNREKDVRLIKALLNVYFRVKDKSKVMKITSTSDEAFIEAISSFQKDHQKIANPDGQVTSRASKSFRALVDFMKSRRTVKAITPPKKAIVTWEAEGQEGGVFHSRVLHVPPGESGLTIGRGYDMANRTKGGIEHHLKQAGVDAAKSAVIAKANGLKKSNAQQFIIDNDLLDFEITPDAQLKLFNTVYAELEKDVIRICSGQKSKVAKAYGIVDWDKLDEAIKVILIDMRFRGDYNLTARKHLQAHVVANDFKSFKNVLLDSTKWTKWPSDRYRRRKEYIEKAALEKRKKGHEAGAKTSGEGVKIIMPNTIGTPE